MNLQISKTRRLGIAAGTATILGSGILIGVGATPASADAMYPVIAESMSECDLIDIGVQGTCVDTVQETLNQSQNEGLPVDSQYGPATKDAVYRFQLAHGLEADGVVGERTKQALRQVMQDAAEKLDAGGVESGTNSWVTDALCGLSGPFVLGCEVLTH